MKKLLLLIAFVVSGIAHSYAQNYDSAVGLRIGIPNSITYKKFVSESSAFEVYGGLRSFFGSTFINANAAYLIHAPIEAVENLQWYYGGGAGVGFGSNGGNSFTTLSLGGYIGLEYGFDDIPIVLSIDYVPTYFLGSSNLGLQGGFGNFAVRYILNE